MSWLFGVGCFLAGVVFGYVMVMWLARGHQRKVDGHYLEVPEPWVAPWEGDR